MINGKGNFTLEYKACLSFILEGLKLWLQGPRPGNELWLVPELGTTHEYKLSCFPDVWAGTIVLGQDMQTIWKELLS